MWICAHVNAGTLGVLKRGPAPWGLEFEAVMSHPKWVLGTELRPSASSTCS